MRNYEVTGNCSEYHIYIYSILCYRWKLLCIYICVSLIITNCDPGQFYHGIGFEVGDQRPGEAPEKPDATMYVKGHQLNVTRYTCCLTCVSQNSEHLDRKFGEKMISDF